MIDPSILPDQIGLMLTLVVLFMCLIFWWED